MSASLDRIDWKRNRAARRLLDRATVLRFAAAVEADAGQESVVAYPDGYTVVASDLSCALDYDGAATEAQYALGIKGGARYKLRLAYSQSAALIIDSTMRVRITSMNNRDFEIVHVPDKSNMVVRILELKEISGLST